MKKIFAILSLLAVLTACAEQPAMEKADMIELTAATSETAFAETESSPAPAAAQAATPNAEPTAAPTPEPTAEPAPVPTAAPTESPAVQAAEAPAQVSMSYGAVPFDLAAGTEQWWSIDSSDNAYWAVQENINAMRTSGGLAPTGYGWQPGALCQHYGAEFYQHGCGLLVLLYRRWTVHLLDGYI